MRDSVETRARILKTAERIFSEEGFDGARVDTIAKEAGVNKALIYYYFKSKEEILETILSGLFEDAKNMIIRSAENTPDISGDNYRELFDMYIDFVTKNRKIIKIAVAESAKGNKKSSVIMELGKIIVNAEIEKIRRSYNAKGLHFPEDEKELLVMEFFTGLMPFLAYALYTEQWESVYNISEDELRETLYRVYQKTHLAAHLE